MRCASSTCASLQRAMSSTSSYPRRGRRAFSDRPSPSLPPPAAASSGDFVSGDSHISTVRGANYGLRRGGGGAHWYPSRRPPPPLPAAPYPPFPYGYGPPPPQPYGYGPTQPYGYGPPPQPYNGSQPPQVQYGGYPPNVRFRPSMQHQLQPPSAPPQPRLADYRRLWRFARWQPPQHTERFKVLSYNILADYLAMEHRSLYHHIPRYFLDWRWRKEKLLLEFTLWSPDILCLQEVDRFSDLEQELVNRGYSGVWKMRTGKAVDGCAVFWRTARFQLRYEENIEFNKLGLRDNVAQLCVLESTVPGNGEDKSACLPMSSNEPQFNQVVVCNIHVLYNPKRGEIKLGQVRTLLDRAYAVSKMWNDAPVILCGDFNSTPKSALYNFISEQKLNLSGLARNEISGQYSATSSQWSYTGPDMSRNSTEGSSSLNNLKPRSDTSNMVEEPRPAGTGPVCTDNFLGDCSNAHLNNNCCEIPCSSTSNFDEQGLLNTAEGPSKDVQSSDTPARDMSCNMDTAESQECARVDNASKELSAGGIVEPGEEGNVADLPSAPSMVSSDILQSHSSKLVDNTPPDSSHESSGGKDPFENLEYNSNEDSVARRDFPGNVIADKPACSSVEYAGQSDIVTDKSSESTGLGDSLNIADSLDEFSNLKIPEATSSEDASDLRLLEKSTHHPYSAASDTSQHSDHASSSPDPDFFKELIGSNECLLEDEDELPTNSGGPFTLQEFRPAERYNYDPYIWTPEEIKAASGNEECTSIEHKLKLRSVYSDVEDFAGTRDANNEPEVTSYNTQFMGTVDYIWRSEDLQTVSVLDTFPKDILRQTNGFPTKKWGSDHIALVCMLAFTKGSSKK